jgi:ketosteroid isomerase-like protein
MSKPIKQAEKEALKQLLIDTFRAENEKNLEKYVSFFHEDLISLPPGMPMVKGNQFVRDMVKEALKTMVLSEHKLLHVDVSDSGDMGYVVATYRMVFDGPDGQIEDSGKFLSTFKKQNGEWKFTTQCWNNDKPHE